jgi:hypothetical protein
MIKIKLPFPPFSTNSAYYKNGGKTAACRTWQNAILIYMQRAEIQRSLQSIKKRFDPTRHGIAVKYCFYQPSDKIFTHGGELSRRSMDLTNVEKLIQDLLFDKRYEGRILKSSKDGKTVHHTIHNLNLDDKFVCRVLSEKRAIKPEFDKHKKYCIEIEMELILTVNLVET